MTSAQKYFLVSDLTEGGVDTVGGIHCKALRSILKAVALALLAKRSCV